MGATEQRSLEWADGAPLIIRATATSTAPPEAVFAVLADHERWPEWFGAVRRVVVTGAREGVGATRRRAPTPLAGPITVTRRTDGNHSGHRS